MIYIAFVAPIHMRTGDIVKLLFGKPVVIERDGVVIWKDESFAETGKLEFQINPNDWKPVCGNTEL